MGRKCALHALPQVGTVEGLDEGLEEGLLVGTMEGEGDGMPLGIEDGASDFPLFEDPAVMVIGALKRDARVMTAVVTFMLNKSS